MRAVQVTQFGGPEVLDLVELPDPEPRAGSVVLDVATIGVNYADTHQAENSYLAPQTLPFVPGSEVVGTTPDGRRVAALVGTGGYAEKAHATAATIFELPDDVDDVAALALVVQGLTAWHLLRTCAHLAAGESVVVHAAAGGVGSIAVQLAKLFGAGTVIATASTPEKRQLALDIGADVAIDPAVDDLRDALRSAGGRAGVDVVLEMTGGRVFDRVPVGARAVRPPGHLWHRVAAAADAGGPRRSGCPVSRCHRFLARALHPASRDAVAALRRVARARPRGPAASHRRAELPVDRGPAGARGPSGAAYHGQGRPASPRQLIPTSMWNGA